MVSEATSSSIVIGCDSFKPNNVEIKRAAIFGSPSKSRIIQTHKRTCDAMLGTCSVPILDKNLEFLGLHQESASLGTNLEILGFYQETRFGKNS
jgi:hypothetical protein